MPERDGGERHMSTQTQYIDVDGHVPLPCTCVTPFNP